MDVMITRKPRPNKGMVSILLMVFIALSVWFLFVFVCDQVQGADLSTKADMQTAIYQRIQATSSNNFFDTLMIQTAINYAMNFVEYQTKANKSIGTITLNPDSFFYALPSAAATDGVLRVLRANSMTGNLEALTERDVADFGKAEFEPQMIYSVIGDSLMIYQTPDVTDILYVFSWKMTSDLTAGASTIDIPLAYRRMILDMAVAECARMQGDIQTWSTVRQAIIQEIYGLPDEPDSEPQELGLEGKP